MSEPTQRGEETEDPIFFSLTAERLGRRLQPVLAVQLKKAYPPEAWAYGATVARTVASFFFFSSVARKGNG